MCRRNGTCTHGCVDGWTGPMCDRQCSSHCLLCSEAALCQRCEPGWYVDITLSGSQCATCPDQCTDCDNMDDCTTCLDGWAGSRCQCSENCDGGLQGCDQNTGRCTSGCVQNYYGDSCDVQCDACLRCNQSTGVCTACRHGYFGLQCDETCSSGCSESPDGEVHCDISTGRCLTSCVTGYSGDTCSGDITTYEYDSKTRDIRYACVGFNLDYDAIDPGIDVDEGPVVGAAVGGLFGGIVLTAVVAVVLVHFWRRSRKSGPGNRHHEEQTTEIATQTPEVAESLPSPSTYEIIPEPINPQYERLRRHINDKDSEYQSMRKSGAHTDDDNNYVNDGESQMYENEDVAVTISDNTLI
ncbi:hypothetical protein ScPMuIL_005972 [Solemya velum]